MPKKLAIFCDGTWQGLRNRAFTNVVKLARTVAAHSEDGRQQIVFYDEGVGVTSDVSPLVDLLTRYLGGAFGRGLTRKIEQAYQFLVVNYEPGDDIYVFGFSRGAYTARSLCGLIRKCGIVRRDAFARIPEALKLYRNNLHPADPRMVAFRRHYTHELATGKEDYDRLGMADCALPDQPMRTAHRQHLYQYRPDGCYRLMFAGIWDTVGALGVPRRFDLLNLDRDYRFHDTQASSLIASIRHAVAGNEQRIDFDVTPFSNLDTLNNAWARATCWDVNDRAAANFVPYNHRPYQERWFPGDHGAVGGGTEDSALSAAALLWMAEGARSAGLSFNPDPDLPLGEAARIANPLGPLGGSGSIRAPRGRRRRAGPANHDQIAAQSRLRFLRDRDYRPPNLLPGLKAGGGRDGPPPAGFPPAA
ncbi:DUF2235 domain-containing protein [Sphingomonas sp.]|uniref:DUF2235 domain-containing protein n=1 Tax=Sphingomonas sp. TaxID=28214 RepID=UPI001DC48827|nr:DUF2235 domain-containing protein [Sphingomonas sp.]MBX9796179.1 DUF2235 domain-containing protein [Sphingomonas sp.]